MASVSKRKWTYKGVEKSAWVLRYVDKAGRRHSDTFPTKKAADQARIRIEGEIEMGVHTAARDTCTVAEAGDLFIAECERRLRIKDRMTRTTLSNYRNYTRHVVERFGKTRLTNLNAVEIQDWLNDFCTRYSRQSVEHVYQMLKLMLSHAVSRGYISRNIVVHGRIRIPSRDKERIAVPSIEEARRLLAALAQREPAERHAAFHARRVAVHLAIFGGLRRGEICGLQWENVRFDRGLIQVRQSLSQLDGLKAPKTKAGVRDVPISPTVLDVLLEAHVAQGSPATGHVVKNHQGGKIRPTHLWTLWKHVAAKAGLVDEQGVPLYHFHALRHVAASLLIADGLTPLHVKTFIGHARVSTTLDVYGHLFPEDERIRASVGKVAERFFMSQGCSNNVQAIENKVI